MSVIAPCRSLDDFHAALTFMPILIFEGSTSPRLWRIPIPGVAPSRSTTATSIGVFNRLGQFPLLQLGPYYRDCSNLHPVAPCLSETCSSIFLHLSLARFSPKLPEDLADLHHTRSRNRITDP